MNIQKGNLYSSSRRGRRFLTRNATTSTVSECKSACISYLQILKNLCEAGNRVAKAVSSLAQETGVAQAAIATPHPVANQFVTAWDNLARTTAASAQTAKSYVYNILDDLVILPNATPGQRESNIVQEIRIRNQQISQKTTEIMIDIQHQFGVASCDSFAALKYGLSHAPKHDGDCAVVPPDYPRNRTHSTLSASEKIIGTSIPSRKLAQGFLDIHGQVSDPSKLPAGMSAPFTPWNIERRSSEVLAGSVKHELSMRHPQNETRRWSNPWEASNNGNGNLMSWDQTNITPIPMPDIYARQFSGSKLQSSDTSSDDLAHAIRLLSYRPVPKHPNQEHQDCAGSDFAAP